MGIQRAFFRNILMYGFHFLVTTLGGVRGVRDTQVKNNNITPIIYESFI